LALVGRSRWRAAERRRSERSAEGMNGPGFGSLPMRQVLVTGGAGFIGGNFVHYWLRQHPGDRLVVLDALTYAGNLATLQLTKSPDLRFVHGNICNGALVENLLREERLDTIV